MPHKMIADSNYAKLKKKDICQAQKQVVRIAYNNLIFNYNDRSLIVKDGVMIDQPIRPLRRIGRAGHIPLDFEILKAFFINFNMTPEWIYCNQTWGWFEEETGNWTGVRGKVRIDSGNLQDKHAPSCK